MGRFLSSLLLILAGICFVAALFAHPDVNEPKLLLHYVATGHPIQNGTVSDETHHVTAKLIGAPKLVTLGPAEALQFDGKHDYLLLAAELAEAKAALPTREFSVAAWVNLNSVDQEWGGIVGALQDNADKEQGWLLGYQTGKFVFGLATKGADDGDGKLTYLAAQDEIEPGRWYHVAATYDGKITRLFVNGKQEAESTKQSGDILYPPKADFAIGGYIDQDEKHLLDGAIYEVKILGRVMTADEFTKLAAKNDNLINYLDPTPGKLKFLIKPYLQAGTLNAMTVMCETTQTAKMTVKYGLQVPLTQTATAEKADQAARINTVRLEDLDPGTPYFYQVTCTNKLGESITSELYSLQTDRGPEHAWAFGIIGDTQRNPEITRKCAEGIYANRPNMLIHCGDVVDDGYAKNQWVKDLFNPMENLLARVPMFPTIGNHEQNSHWYYDYFSLPQPEYYYTFKYGNAQFFMIDTNKPVHSETEQYKWLEQELSRSKATWKFTCHHHPCFSSDEDDYGNHNKGDYKQKPTWGDPNAQKLIPLYERYGVDIAFNGHIHVYERTWPIYQMSINQQKGVRYLTSGGGGGGLEQAAPQRTWFNHHFKRVHHYCYAVIHDRTIQFKAYDVDDKLFDTFELTKADER